MPRQQMSENRHLQEKRLGKGLFPKVSTLLTRSGPIQMFGRVLLFGVFKRGNKPPVLPGEAELQD
ncbi:hypothetical protein CLOSTMETH_03380, partial [[Clostridium] methylpentosum DSM 5476]